MFKKLTQIINELERSVRRRLLMPFPEMIVPPGATRTIEAHPQCLYQVESLKLAAYSNDNKVSDLSSHVVVDDIRVGSASAYGSVGPVGMPIDWKARLEPSGVGCFFTLTVRNRGSDVAVVRGVAGVDAMRYNATALLLELKALREQVRTEGDVVSVAQDPEPRSVILPFNITPLEPGRSAEVSTQSGSDIEIERIEMRVLTTDREPIKRAVDTILVEDILVGGVSQYIARGAVPLSMIVNHPVLFDKSVARQEISLRLKNAGSQHVVLEGCYHGRAC